MDLLILGGTRFVGRAVVLDALARGWTVTAVNRGLSGPLRAEVEQIAVDRTGTGALATALAGRHFDVAVDTWAGAPRVVRDAADVLVGRVRRFGYVSSQSVYVDGRPAGGDESWPTVQADAGADTTDYAADKRGGELSALRAFPDAVLARAGLVLGPWENVGRLPWWLARCNRGGRVVAPGRPDRLLQYVDVRDLAAWLNDALIGGVTGPVDLTCPVGHTSMGTLLEAVRETTGARAELVWIPQDAVLASGAEPWTQLPCWVPDTEEYAGFMAGDTSTAIATGLRSRPIGETVRDTWTWLQADGMPTPAPARAAQGLPPEIEAALLAADTTRDPSTTTWPDRPR
jgi:nucleoside-diphosphate-sugar epimerase